MQDMFAEQQSARYEEDIWQPDVEKYLDLRLEAREDVLIGDILAYMGVTRDRQGRALQNRVKGILVRLGWKRGRRTENGRPWLPPSPKPASANDRHSAPMTDSESDWLGTNAYNDCLNDQLTDMTDLSAQCAGEGSVDDTDSSSCSGDTEKGRRRGVGIDGQSASQSEEEQNQQTKADDRKPKVGQDGPDIVYIQHSPKPAADPAADLERAVRTAQMSLYSCGGTVTEDRWRGEYVTHGGSRPLFAPARDRLLMQGVVVRIGAMFSPTAPSPTQH
jgi:hypothetical protein